MDIPPVMSTIHKEDTCTPLNPVDFLEDTVMSEQPTLHDAHPWDEYTPSQVLNMLLSNLYAPVSVLSNQVNRLAVDEDPLTEEDMDDILDQMQTSVRQLSRTIINLKRYIQEHDRHASHISPTD